MEKFVSLKDIRHFWNRLRARVFGSSPTPRRPFPGRRRPKPIHPSNGRPPFLWDYAEKYSVNMGEGHQKPPPSFGSPTFIMHLGIWQKQQGEETDLSFGKGAITEKYRDFDRRNEIFFEEINHIIANIQSKGRVVGSPVETFEFSPVRFAMEPGDMTLQPEDMTHGAHRFKSHDPQSISFTLWWLDSDDQGKPVENRRQERPDKTSLRVRVQAQVHEDHVTLSFYIDAWKPHDRAQIYSPEHAKDIDIGRRRRHIRRYLEALRQLSAQQTETGAIERERLPELNVSEEDAKLLLEAADYIYDGIWKEFMESFGIADLPLLRERDAPDGEAAAAFESEGERFADCRGFLMSVKGLDTPGNNARRERVKDLRAMLGIPAPEDPLEQNANVGVGSVPVFDFSCNEPNTVLKSFWPFLRRMTPWADFRDFIGCGLIGGRLLFVTPLGAGASYYSLAERNQEGHAERVKRLHLPREELQEGRLTGNFPIRYLILTKGEPHREQAGRFVERVNAVMSSRLFAFKDFTIIKNASYHIRLLGRELDGALQEWGRGRKRIDDQSEWKRCCHWDQRYSERERLLTEEIMATPEDAVAWYLARGKSNVDDAWREEIRARYRERYKRFGRPFRELLESNFDDIGWIEGVTIYEIMVEYYLAHPREERQSANGGVLGLNKVWEAAENYFTEDNTYFLGDITKKVKKRIAESGQPIPPAWEQLLQDEEAEKVEELVKDTEERLVEIGAALDNIGNGGSGRILYIINRAKFHIAEFERLVRTLQIENIDGWINYEQFIQRGLMPAFTLVHMAGDRLVSLRERLQSVTEMIQTSALIAEAEATRANTATLRRIASNLYMASIFIAVIAAVLVGQALGEVLDGGKFIRWAPLLAVIGYYGWDQLKRLMNTGRRNRR